MQLRFYAGSNWVGVPGEAGDGAVAKEALERSDVVQESLLYIACAIFSTLHTLEENSHMYMVKDEELSAWPEMTKCQWETGRFPLVFYEVLLRMTEVLDVTNSQALTTKKVEVDENGNVVTRKVESSRGSMTIRDSFRLEPVISFDWAASARKTSTKRELSPCDVGIAPVNKKSPVFSLPPSAPPQMSDVKVENFETENSSLICLELSFSASTAYKQLQIGIKSVVCIVYDDPFQRLLKAVEHSSNDASKYWHAVT